MAATAKLDSLTIGATTYSNVNVLGANTTDLYFTHDKGIANVKLKYLPPDLQKKFNFDPTTAAAAERKQLEEDARYQKSLATSVSAQVQKEARSAHRRDTSTPETIADPITDNSLLGKTAPELKAEKWLGDRPSLEGKFVLVNFLAPWSMPCRKAIPELNALQKKFPEKLAVVGITADSEADLAEMGDIKMDFPMGIDTKAQLSGAAGVTSVPCVLLIDPKGVVRYQGHPSAISEARLKALLAKAGEEK
jgi:thiol-disulfide isomerase/thioredoxin